MKTIIKSIYSNSHILKAMSISQFKVKYSGSILGVWHAVINPILVMFAINFVFTTVIKLDIRNFSLFALSGIFPWFFFSNAIYEGTLSVVNQNNFLRQFKLPLEIIPLASVISNFLNFLIGLCVVYPIFIFFNYKILVFFPLLVIILFLNLLFVCGLSLILSVLNGFYRDFGHLLGVILMLWFWITPVFYSRDMIPLDVRWVFNINPMTYYVECYRELIFGNSMPGLFMILGAVSWCVFSVISGLFIFSFYKNKLLKKI